MTKPAVTSIAEKMRELLGSQEQVILLDDLVTSRIKLVAQALAPEAFPTSVPISNDEFVKRAKRYEDVVADLVPIVVLLAKWGEGRQLPTLAKIYSRLAELPPASNGIVGWVRLGWHPLHFLIYAGGVAAMSARNYPALKAVLMAPVYSREGDSESFEQPVLVRALKAILEIGDSFKAFPGFEKKRLPRSEYMHSLIHKPIEDEVFLSASYDTHFDEFEIVVGLLIADFEKMRGSSAWGPMGRFVWRHSSGSKTSSYGRFLSEVAAAGENWDGLRAGLFGSSVERLKEIVEAYNTNVARGSTW